MAIFPKSEPSPPAKSTLAGPKALLLGAVLGLVVGGAGVLAFMRTPRPPAELPPNTLPANETVVSPQFDSSPTVLLTPPQPDWMTRALRGAFTTPPVAPPGPAGPKPVEGTPATPLRIQPPPSMRGDILTTPAPTGNLSLAPVKPPPPPVSMDVQLVKLDVYDANPVLDAGAVEAFAKSLGATVRQLSDFKDADGREADALLVLIPEDKLSQFVTYITSKQPNVLDSSWKGAAEGRQSRLYDESQRQLEAMERKKKELLMKFLEDASAVKVVNEAIAKLKTTLGRLKIEQKLEKLAAVKVTYRPKN